MQISLARGCSTVKNVKNPEISVDFTSEEMMNAQTASTEKKLTPAALLEQRAEVYGHIKQSLVFRPQYCFPSVRLCYDGSWRLSVAVYEIEINALYRHPDK